MYSASALAISMLEEPDYRTVALLINRTDLVQVNEHNKWCAFLFDIVKLNKFGHSVLRVLSAFAICDNIVGGLIGRS
jgi:hypothetical protein